MSLTQHKALHLLHNCLLPSVLIELPYPPAMSNFQLPSPVPPWSRTSEILRFKSILSDLCFSVPLTEDSGYAVCPRRSLPARSGHQVEQAVLVLLWFNPYTLKCPGDAPTTPHPVHLRATLKTFWPASNTTVKWIWPWFQFQSCSTYSQCSQFPSTTKSLMYSYITTDSCSHTFPISVALAWALTALLAKVKHLQGREGDKKVTHTDFIPCGQFNIKNYPQYTFCQFKCGKDSHKMI